MVRGFPSVVIGMAPPYGYKQNLQRGSVKCNVSFARPVFFGLFCRAFLRESSRVISLIVGMQLYPPVLPCRSLKPGREGGRVTIINFGL